MHPLGLLAARRPLVDTAHRANTVSNERRPVALDARLTRVPVALTRGPTRPLGVRLATPHRSATLANRHKSLQKSAGPK